MLVSQAVRDARKKAQLKRLAKKGDDDYPEFYANQPQQRAKARANAQITLDKLKVVETAEALQIAEITGEGLLAAQEKATVARLVLQKHVEAQRPSTYITLSSVAGA